MKWKSFTTKSSKDDERRSPGLRGLFIILNREAPSSRYRVLQYQPFLTEAGIIPTIREMPKGMGRRLLALADLRKFDLVFLQKRLCPLPEWHYMRSRSQRIIFDYDDAIIYRDSMHGGGVSSSRLRRFERIVKGAELVVAGNGYLREMARGYARRIVTIPTPVDLNRYSEKRPNGSRTVTIGWIGSASTLLYLEALHSVLKEVCEDGRRARVRIVSDAFPEWDDLPLERKPWRLEEEADDLRGFDIGIMPLRDDPWSRGKCGFKILQYMAAGLPVVCSPVGVNVEMVLDGCNGFQAGSPEEWIRSLRRLIDDPELRRRLGSRGRSIVTDRYSLENCATGLVSALKGLFEAGPYPL